MSGASVSGHAAVIPSHEEFNRELAAAARMQDEGSSREAMERAVAIATEILTGCDAAGVCVVYRGERVDTHATSNDALRQVDALQHELREGPCRDALRQHDTVHSSDLSVDERWPRWGPEVASRLGLFSIVSYRLFSIGDNLGALNLYGKTRSAFCTDDVTTAPLSRRTSGSPWRARRKSRFWRRHSRAEL